MKTTISKNLVEIINKQADLPALSQRISEKVQYIGFMLTVLDIQQDDNNLQDLDQAARELQENAQELQRAADNILTTCKQIRSQAAELRFDLNVKQGLDELTGLDELI